MYYLPFSIEITLNIWNKVWNLQRNLFPFRFFFSNVIVVVVLGSFLFRWFVSCRVASLLVRSCWFGSDWQRRRRRQIKSTGKSFCGLINRRSSRRQTGADGGRRKKETLLSSTSPGITHRCLPPQPHPLHKRALKLDRSCSYDKLFRGSFSSQHVMS